MIKFCPLGFIWPPILEAILDFHENQFWDISSSKLRILAHKVKGQ